MTNDSRYKLFEKEIKTKKNFSDILETVSFFYPDKIFLVENNNHFSFKKFNQMVDNCCGYFFNQKLKSNDVVSLLLPNSLEFIILYFACIRYGIIVNPLPYSSNNASIKHSLNISKSKIIFSDRKILKNTSINNIIINNLNLFLINIKKYNFYKSKKKINNKKIAAYYFSSGTTSLPKLISYSHQAMVQCQKLLNNSNFLPKFSNHMCILPLGHTAAMRYSIKNSIINVGKVFLYKNYWSIKDSFWKEIKKNKINFIGCVPTILQAIYINSSKQKKIPSLKFFGCGSSTLSKNFQIQFEKKFKTKISNIYGMSEIGVASFENPYKKKRKIGSIGQPLLGIKMVLFKNKKIITSNNVIGEIGIKTPAIFSGYITSKKNKLLKIKEFFMTGDLAIKKNKYFYFIDRSKDIIIKGGVNISPQEIDDCIISYNKVSESATIAIKDSFFGENIKSYVVLKYGYAKKKIDIINFCKKKLGNYKAPLEVVFVKELPKTPSGKIIKRLLKD